MRRMCHFNKWLVAGMFALTALTTPAQTASSKFYTIGGTARVVFKVNDARIRPDVSQNREELDKLTAMLNEVLSDPTAEVQRVVICGYGSPDGPFAFNERLARQRTNNLKAYTARYAGIPQNAIEVRYVAEDWEGLAAFVQNASLTQLPHRDQLLQVIRSNRNPNKKERIIRRQYPKDFNYLKKHCLAQLRRTDYRIEYRTKNREAALHWEEVQKSSGKQHTGKTVTFMQPQGGIFMQPRGRALTQPQGSALTQPQGSALTQPQGSALTQPQGSALTQPQGSALTQQQKDSLTQQLKNALVQQLTDSVARQFKDSIAQQLEDSIVQQLKDSLMLQMKDSLMLQMKDSLALQQNDGLLQSKAKDSQQQHGGTMLWLLLLLLILLVAAALILRYAAVLRQKNKTISLLKAKMEQDRQAMIRKAQERAAVMSQSRNVINEPKSNTTVDSTPVIVPVKEDEAPEDHTEELPAEEPAAEVSVEEPAAEVPVVEAPAAAPVVEAPAVAEVPAEESAAAEVPAEEPAAAEVPAVEEPAAAEVPAVEEPAAAPVVENSQDYERFKKLDDAVTERKLFLDADMSRVQLMRIAGVDKNKFAMLLRQYAGTNFSGYINSKRMEYAAKQLTEHPEYTMKDIAASCGFSSLSTFFRVFKSVYGTTPTEYLQTGKQPQTAGENPE